MCFYDKSEKLYSVTPCDQTTCWTYLSVQLVVQMPAHRALLNSGWRKL